MRCRAFLVVALAGLLSSPALCSSDGDVTNDRLVRIEDAVRALRIALSPSEGTESERLHADVYPIGFPAIGDGQVTVDDARSILRIAGGLAIPPKGLSGVSATTVGSGRIVVYFDVFPNATEYKVFRREEGQAYGAPLPLVPQPTYTGSANMMALDTVGLTDGTTYYYVVVAVVNGVDSAPSAEVSAFPDSRGIPWDKRNESDGPAAILSAVRALYQGSGLPVGSGQGLLIVGGPDKSQYTESAGGVATVDAPSSTIDPFSGEVVFTDGTTHIFPNDLPIQVKGARRTVAFPNAGGSGPFRRVETRPGVDFTGVRGTVTLVSRDDTRESAAPGIYLAPADIRWRDANGNLETNPDGTAKFRSTRDTP